ncbi:MAG: MBL fold metallo-hydrolase [Rhodospirillaceae bacterium]
MRVTILGSGSAGGVPSISAGWGKCDPAEPRNRRTRPGILVEAAGTHILVDTSPDLREHLLRSNVKRLDAVVYTHFHADHVNGIDDLREINRAMQRAIPCYGDALTMEDLQRRFDYVFLGVPEGQPIFRPWLQPHRIDGPFDVGAITVTAFEQDHGWGTSLGLRFGDVAYSTDVVRLDHAALTALKGVKVWIVGCLTDQPHATHAHIDLVLEWVRELRPERTILTHMGPRLDYATLRDSLPNGVEPGYDGMIVDT